MLPDAASPDARIADEHVHCRACGYALRGLDPGGACPECGLPIVQSLTNPLSADPQWRRAVTRGTAVLAWAVGGSLGVGVLLLVGGVAIVTGHDPGTVYPWAVLAIAGTALGLGLPGLWLIDRPEHPGLPRRDASRRIERWIGIGGGLMALAGAGAVVVWLTAVPIAMPDLRPQAAMLLTWITPLFMAAGLRSLSLQLSLWLRRGGGWRPAVSCAVAAEAFRVTWWLHLAATAMFFPFVILMEVGTSFIELAGCAWVLFALAAGGGTLIGWVATAALTVQLAIASRRLRAG